MDTTLATEVRKEVRTMAKQALVLSACVVLGVFVLVMVWTSAYQQGKEVGFHQGKMAAPAQRTAR